MQIRRCGVVRRVLVVIAVLAATEGNASADGPEGLPAGMVSFVDAVDAALRHDPTLAVHGFEQRARAARTRQEGRLPNPTLATEVENVAKFGGDEHEAEAAQTTVSLTQVFELTGKRAQRVEMARREERLAGWDSDRARLETTARVRKAFVAGLLAQDRVGLAERLQRLARESRDAARRQLAGGGGSSIEVARAEAAMASATALVARRERESRAARAALAARWGGDGGAVTGLVGALAPLPEPRPFDELRAALSADPDLARFDDALARGEAEAALEEARRVPDLAVRVGARRFVRAESNALVAELSLPLPVFDRNADAITEARERLGKLHAERRATAAAAEVALQAEHAELEAAWEEARALERDVLPRVRAALAETRRGYGEGRLRYLEVLEAERAIAEGEDAYIAALARVQTSAAEISRMTGAPAVRSKGDER